MSTACRRRSVLLALLASAALTAWVGAGAAQAEAQIGKRADAPGLRVSLSPPLYPPFSPAISDYVSRCGADQPISLAVSASAHTVVDIAGGGSHAGSFTAQLGPRGAGQALAFTVRTPRGAASTYYVRCLPADFPGWRARPSRHPQAEFYIVTPWSPAAFYKGLAGVPQDPSDQYVAIFDSDGVPIWWMREQIGLPKDAKLLPDGDIAWNANYQVEEHRLDGSLVRVIRAGDLHTDEHDFRLLPDGDYLIAGDRVRSGVNLSPWGQASAAKVWDQEIEEVTPESAVVGSWDVMDHIPLSEVDPIWWTNVPRLYADYDLYHLNSVEPTAHGLLISLRSEDAVYMISYSTGRVLWKVGGTRRPESLAVRGDFEFRGGGGWGGQHDAHLIAGGVLTVHDNGNGRGRAPRAVAYKIDPGHRTATLDDQITDPAAPSSGCCGSARRLPGGDWVISWGSDPVVTEMTSSGHRVFGLFFDSGRLSYRVDPVPFGTLSRSTLRRDMDAMSWMPSMQPVPEV